MVQNILQSITTHWQQPGTNLIITDASVTGSFWQQLRTSLPNSTVVHAPNTLSECPGWIGQLSQSFLGQQGVYWITTPATWAPKAKKEVLSFLNAYVGPHALWLVLDQDTAALLQKKSVKRHIISAEVALKDLGSIADMLQVPRASRALQQAGVMRLPGSVSLDVAASVVRHAEYVPMRTQEVAQTYLKRLLPNHSSLVGLADLFFQQRWPAFLSAWQQTADAYSDMFWVAFWTEQCWRAYWVCFYQRNKQSARARAMAYRLPSAFIHSYWQKQSPKKLLNLFDKLSFFDTRVKKGSSFTLSELLTVTMNAERMQ